MQEGYSLSPVAALAEPHNPVYVPLIFALRAYLEVFVLKKNRVSCGDSLEEGLPLARFRYPAYNTCFRHSGTCWLVALATRFVSVGLHGFATKMILAKYSHQNRLRRLVSPYQG